MIILAVLNFFFSLITLLFNSFNFPSISDTVMDTFTEYFDMLGDAFSCIFFFVPSIAVNIALLSLALEVAYRVYIFVMWLVRKLPFGSE